LRKLNRNYNMQTRKLLLFLSFSFITFLSIAQSATIRGYVREKKNGEPILFIKVKVIDAAGASFRATTDLNGFFSIPKLDVGKYNLVIDNDGYKKLEKKVEVVKPSGIIDLEFELEEDAEELGEVEVSASQKQKTTQVGNSEIRLSKKEVERIPSQGGESDVVAALSVTPGVTTTGDQGGQLYVRGGTPIQNKILLDGMTIYTPFHSIGFFSIFETELIKNVDIYTGGFDSKYGGRISSVMDITYRDGDRKSFGGKVSVSPFLAKLVLEGPFTRSSDGKPSKASYVFSAKHSLLDYTSQNLYPRVNEGNGLPFAFTDLYGKVTLNAQGGSKFSFFGFSNNDKVKYTNVADLAWRQAGGGMNFVLVPIGSPVFIRGHLNASNYSLSFLEQGLPERTSSIGGADLGFDFTFFQKNEGQIDVGININGFQTKYLTYNEAARKIEDQNFTFEVGSYINYRVIKGRWVIQPGFRAQTYASRGVISPEPRLGLKYNMTEKMRLKISGGRYSQNFTSASSDKDVVNLFNGLLSSPTNLQSTFVTESGKEKEVRNGLQYAWHAIVGYELDLNKHLSVNIEAYYKYFSQLSNINQNKLYDDVAEFSDIDDVFKKDFIIESGKSYGADLLVKYAKDRLFIWTVYSYGKSTRWDGFQTYAPVFDRRHNVNVVSSYTFGKKKSLEVNIRWNFGSGLPFTPTAGYYQNETFQNGVTTNINTSNANNVTVLLGDFNSKRLPTYHRLDITVKKNFTFKNKTVMEIVASVTNLYDRKNLFYVNRVTNQKIYQFPALPSLGVSYKF
jgi:hypothetical protein